ncbi:MAG: hypothetical protein QS748_04270 [Candidatus Endonucleobacter bathymodioli]|uniref:Uncharacterized protein n=1 Tax=Candidatus Endonucleibacter bathymodioli TaxID=539814 RepID=A0AA90NK80_9GAMM|nr:hypothetical protein [Candidatus Endonucleobacter bathymodioli]
MFFLVGIIETAENAVAALREIMSLKSTIEVKLVSSMGKRSKNALLLLHELFKDPVVNIKKVESMTLLSGKAANDLVKAFVEQGILQEVTGYRRNRTFVFSDYLNLFDNKGSRHESFKTNF